MHPVATSSSDRGQLGGDLAQDLRDRPLELAHAGLAGVVGRDDAQRLVLDDDLVVGQAGALALPGEQVVAGDRDLLLLGVAVEPDELHPVEQRLGDGLDHVGGGQEHHVGQVEVELEVVVAEGVVLRRVEHLEQCRCRVAAVVGADLVDLVEQDDRVHRAGLLDGADDPAGQRADVRTPVAADLGLVAYAAEGDPDEVAAEGACDGLAERGLADPGRAGECEHGAGAATAGDLEPARGATGAHGEVLDDPVLHVLQAGVVGVEDAPGLLDVGGVVGADAPGELEHGVEPGADPAGLGRRVGGALELVGLAQRCLADRLGQVGGLDAATGSRRRPRPRPRRAPCGSRRAAGAAGTRAGSCPCPRGRRRGSARRPRARRGASRPRSTSSSSRSSTSVSSSSWSLTSMSIQVA